MKKTFSIAALCALAFSSNAFAQSGERVFYSSGTGFFVSPYGQIITNEHVVRHCLPDTITVHGAVEGTARVVATDATYDLALLNASLNSPSTGKILMTQRSIQAGDKVMVMGYPLDSGEKGQYQIALSKVIQTQGPQGEPNWLQFTPVLQRGNSGGPLLDTSGNIIGVVSGKTELFEVDPRTKQERSVGQSDVAISLPILKEFLERNDVRYQQTESLVQRSDSLIETEARRFILYIRCETSREQVR